MLALEHRARVLRVPLTPLIDVVFILLMFFMLSSSFVRFHQLEFHAVGSGAVSEAPESARVLLETDGRLRIGAEVYDITDLRFERELARWRDESVTVVVAARPEVPVQTLVDLLDRLRDAGIQTLNLSESVPSP